MARSRQLLPSVSSSETSASQSSSSCTTRGCPKRAAKWSGVVCQQTDIKQPFSIHYCGEERWGTHTHTLSLSLSLTHTHTHTHTLSLSHTHTLSLSLSHTHTLSLSLSLTHTHTHSCTHTHKHTHAPIHTLSLSLSLTHTHTHTHNLSLSLSHTRTHTSSTGDGLSLVAHCYFIYKLSSQQPKWCCNVVHNSFVIFSLTHLNVVKVHNYLFQPNRLTSTSSVGPNDWHYLCMTPLQMVAMPIKFNRKCQISSCQGTVAGASKCKLTGSGFETHLSCWISQTRLAPSWCWEYCGLSGKGGIIQLSPTHFTDALLRLSFKLLDLLLTTGSG